MAGGQEIKIKKKSAKGKKDYPHCMCHGDTDYMRVTLTRGTLNRGMKLSLFSYTPTVLATEL